MLGMLLDRLLGRVDYVLTWNTVALPLCLCKWSCRICLSWCAGMMLMALMSRVGSGESWCEAVLFTDLGTSDLSMRL